MVAEVRQRWRAVIARGDDAVPAVHRAVVEQIEDGLLRSGLPLVVDARRGGRPRLAFAAPMPLGMVTDREPIDLWLVERRTTEVVSSALRAALPQGYRLTDLHDVWLGAPALAACVRGAEYLVILDPSGGSKAEFEAAIDALLSAASLPRDRVKGGGVVSYDLRPLVDDIALTTTEGAVTLGISVRFDQNRGSGRPEEVVAALSEAIGRPITIASTRRERVLLAEDA